MATRNKKENNTIKYFNELCVLNPNLKKGKFYVISDYGKKILEKVEMKRD